MALSSDGLDGKCSHVAERAGTHTVVWKPCRMGQNWFEEQWFSALGSETPLAMWGRHSLQGHAYMHTPTKGGVLLQDVLSWAHAWICGVCWGRLLGHSQPQRPCASLEFLLIAPLWGQKDKLSSPFKQPSTWQAKNGRISALTDSIAQCLRKGHTHQGQVLFFSL